MSQSNLYSIVQANPPISLSLDPSKRYFFQERLKFTMKRQTLKERMSKIQHGIQSLASFVEKAEKLNDGLPQKRCKVKFIAPLEFIRENAYNVHGALLSRWCLSHTSHRAAILLEDRLQRRRRGKQLTQHTTSEQGGEANCFTLCLDDHVPVTKWLSTEFRFLETPSQ